MAIEYISYIQTENLLKSWPIIQGVKESLTLEIQALGDGVNQDEEDDYIYTQVVGNKVLSDIPPAVGKISDTTGNISASYKQVMKHDYYSTLKAIREDKFCIELVDDKLDIAFRRLSFIERKILECFYLKNKTWAEVLEELKKERNYMSRQKAQLERRKAIERVQSISKITVDMYLQVMDLVEVE